jgi:hypothetical protein
MVQVFRGSPDGPGPLVQVFIGGGGPGRLVKVYGGGGPEPLVYQDGCPSQTTYGFPAKHWFPTDLLPEAGLPIKELKKGTLESGRVFFRATGVHQVAVRIRRCISTLDRRCLVTDFDKPTLPTTFTPWLRLDALASSSGGTSWIRHKVLDHDRYYFFDGLHGSLSQEVFFLDEKCHFSKWQTSNGLYYYFGYLDRLPHSIDPPGDFVVEALVMKMYTELEGFPEGSNDPVEV